MTIVTSKRRLFLEVILLLFCLRAFMGNGIDYLIPFYQKRTRMIFLFTMLLLLVFTLKYWRMVQYNKRFWNLAAMATVVLVWNNYNIRYGDTYRDVSLCAVMLLSVVFCSDVDLQWMSLFEKICVFAACFYAFFTYATFLSRDLFMQFYSVFKNYESYNLLSFYNAGYMSGITAHYTTNGIYLATGIIPLSIRVFCNEKKRPKLTDVFMAVAVMGALLLTGKRAHVLFSVAAIIAAIYMYNSNKKHGRFIKLLFGISAVCVILMVIGSFVPQVLNVVERFQSSIEKGDISNYRGIIQQSLFYVIPYHPLAGLGWGWFPWHNFFVQGIYAHNVYLQLLGEVGILGCIPFFIYFATSLIRGVRTLKYSREHSCLNATETMLLTSSTAFQVYFLLYMVTGNPLYDYNGFFPYFTWCAIQEAILIRSKRRMLCDS